MKIVTKETMADLLVRATVAPRKRVNLNLHAELSDPVNRFLNAGVPGNYVQPHRHRLGKWELLNVLQGSLEVIFFTSDGEVKTRVALALNDQSLIEIDGGEWHSLVFHAPAAVVLEVKPGPYELQLDKEFAKWAPSEADPKAPFFQSWLETAMPGETWANIVAHRALKST